MRASTAIATLLLTSTACAPAVPIGELAPVEYRSRNQDRDADLQVMDEWALRLQSLGRRGPDTLAQHEHDAVRERALASAAAWLTFARDEYVRAPASPVVDAALGQAKRIIVDGEEGRPLLPEPVPLVLGTRLVRNDLWTRLDRLGAYSQLDPALLGETAVMLVRAGRVPIPSDSSVCDPAPFLARAEQALAGLVAALPPRQQQRVLTGTDAPSTRMAVRPTPMPVIVRSVHFALDRDSLGPAGREVLDLLAESLRNREGVVVQLQGFADPRGSAAYNLALSRRRALAVQRYLETRTQAVARFEVRPAGRARLTAEGSDRVQLARDRRVELRVVFNDGSQAVKADEIEGDLQLEADRRDGRRAARRGH